MTGELATVDVSPADAPVSAATTAAHAAAPDASGSGARAAGDAADTRKPPFRAAAPLPTQTAPLGSRKYFVPFSIEVEANGKRVFEHRFDATNKPVLIEFPVGTFGDIIGWFPYAVKFQRQH
ncbi:hypothetical protein [Burkholderia sp. WSM2232]|uniref:hypothetical protein n=1 Tax=Burkholderia sp. WSM2232 TaxID=944436 RepID=UPI00041F9641|nr:hypothetical protein [Burkholderia sp. WSM2232]